MICKNQEELTVRYQLHLFKKYWAEKLQAGEPATSTGSKLEAKSWQLNGGL
jgi:hypothetical protein